MLSINAKRRSGAPTGIGSAIGFQFIVVNAHRPTTDTNLILTFTDVGFWHSADNPTARRFVRFRTKADIARLMGGLHFTYNRLFCNDMEWRQFAFKLLISSQKDLTLNQRVAGSSPAAPTTQSPESLKTAVSSQKAANRGGLCDFRLVSALERTTHVRFLTPRLCRPKFRFLGFEMHLGGDRFES